MIIGSRLGVVVGLGAIMEPSGAGLGAIWARLGSVLRSSWPLWRVPGRDLALFWAVLEGLGTRWGSPGGVLGGSREDLGPL